MGTNINTSMTLIPRMHDKGVCIPQLILLGCEHGEVLEKRNHVPGMHN